MTNVGSVDQQTTVDKLSTFAVTLNGNMEGILIHHYCRDLTFNYIIEKFAPEALKRPFHNFTDEDAVADGKKVYIMRPCMIHGPGNKGNLNLLYGVVSKGIPWLLGAFENRRSFTSIGNLQEVIKGLLT